MKKITVNVDIVAPGEVYPCLLIEESGRIVLFEKWQCGTELVGLCGFCRSGHYSTSWTMSGFKPFHGSITLTQE